MADQSVYRWLRSHQLVILLCGTSERMLLLKAVSIIGLNYGFTKNQCVGFAFEQANSESKYNVSV
jgi:hypothetical protein